MAHSLQSCTSISQGIPYHGMLWHGYDLHQSGYGRFQLFPTTPYLGHGLLFPGAMSAPKTAAKQSSKSTKIYQLHSSTWIPSQHSREPTQLNPNRTIPALNGTPDITYHRASKLANWAKDFLNGVLCRWCESWFIWLGLCRSQICFRLDANRKVR